MAKKQKKIGQVQKYGGKFRNIKILDFIIITGFSQWWIGKAILTE